MSHTLTEEQIECLRGCSQYPQYYRGRKDFENNVCPFCVPDSKVNQVLYDTNEWIAWEVPQNFTNRKSTLDSQLLFFPKRHIREPTELTDTERLGYFKVIDWIYRHYDVPGGGIVNRVGDMRYNVGTIMHMHATLFVPNRMGEVLIPLQKSLGMWTEHDVQMQEFARRYEAGEIPKEFQ